MLLQMKQFAKSYVSKQTDLFYKTHFSVSWRGGDSAVGRVLALSGTDPGSMSGTMWSFSVTIW